MTNEMQIKLYKSGGLLLLSIIFAPQFATMVLYGLPIFFASVFAPYFIWKILFNGKFADIKNWSLIWKIPLIIGILVSVLWWEVIAVLLTALFGGNIILEVVIYFTIIILIRIISYGLIYAVWQPQTWRHLKQIGYFLVAIYYVLNVVFMYNVVTSPDIDDTIHTQLQDDAISGVLF